MHKLLIMLSLLMITVAGYAQNRAIIKGKVTDSVTHEPMELATIAVVNLKDTVSSLISYTVSDKKGEFALHNLPAGIPIKVLITFVTYQPVRKFLTLSKGGTVDIGTIILKPNNLKEVTVNGERPPIVIRKDTIEFAAEAFKVRPNAVVEDLLKKLPGVEVDNDGTIHADGKDISKILVDGREFFASDPRIASKNLDADMIDKVQIYDDREDDPDHLLPDSKVKKIINLKFKQKLKKSVFGKVYGGVGTEGRYESGALLNMFRDTLQVSLLGLSNNLSNTGFAINDLFQYAGANRGADGLFRSGAVASGGSNGIQKTISDGVNINTDYGKKLKINLSYYYSHIQVDNNSLSDRQQLLSDTIFNTNSTYYRSRTEDKHNISALIRMQPNDATQIKYSPIFSYADNQAGSNNTANSFSNFVPQITNSINGDNNSGNNLQFQHELTFYHQFKAKGASLNIDHSLQISPANSTDYNNSDVTSYISTFQSYTQNRYTDNTNNNISTNLSISYRYPFNKKITADVNIGSNYNKSINKAAVFDFDPSSGFYDSFLSTLSSDLTRNQWTEHLTPGITYNITKKLSFVGSLSAQWLQINNQFGIGYTDINKSYFYLLPSTTLTLGNASLTYNYAINQPNIGDIIPYTIVFSPLYSVTGNPDLKPTSSNNINFAYRINNFQRQLNINLGTGVSFDENGVFRERTLSASGAETTMPINKDGRYAITSSASLSKRFKKTNNITLNMYTNMYIRESHDFFEINHVDGYQNRLSGSISQRLSINWKDIITLDPFLALSPSYTSYTGVNYNNLSNGNYNFSMPFNLFWPKRMNIAGTYSYNYTPLVSPGFQNSTNLLNLSIAREFLKKDRGEIKLACYDVLNQAISANRTINENIISDTQTQILKRYVLLTLQFKFNKVITK